MDVAADSQQFNGDLPTAQFDPQQLIGTIAQQCQLPAIARNLFPRLDHDASRWLATKPSVYNFDRTNVNRFLNLFFAQVPSTFTSFESFRISSSTHEEGLLAAAAFGGLWRPLAAFTIRTNFPVEVDAKIGLLRPMLLLELFGICSGDKRLCESTEAFHIQFLQASSATGHNNIVLQRILQDFQLLECYRTTLLQILPYLYPGMSIFSLLPQSSTPKEMKIIDIVKELLSPTEPRPDLSDPQTSITALTSLLFLSYHASPSSCVTSP
ncbi:hypothetical protein RAB80_015554 [Fusarium oxysporum f. sp. vasinfectum]|nr:hypothetical protein RAB80_015554 [Fusarium oxysporum f. sp. vasinfectum]